MMLLMRTTLTLPDDVYSIAKSVAVGEDVSLGDALAILVRRGLQPAAGIDTSNGFPMFRVPQGAEPITLERTLALQEEW